MRSTASLLMCAGLLAAFSPPAEPQDGGLRLEDAGVGFRPLAELVNFPWRGPGPFPPKFVGKFEVWLPFQAVLVNDGAAREGTLTLRQTYGGSGEAILYSRRISLPRDGRKRVAFPVRSTYEPMALSFRDDRSGAVRLDGEWEATVPQPRIIPPRADTVLIVADTPGNYGHLLFKNTSREEGPDKILIAIGPDQLPQTAAEYELADLLILDDIAADALSPAQASAIHQWVCRGGALVITLLRNAHRLKGTHLDPLLPGTPADVRNVTSLKAVEELTGFPCKLEGEVAIQSFTAREGAQGDPTLLYRRVDRGQVVTCGFPLSMRGIETWPHAPHFLDSLLKLRRDARIPMPGGTIARNLREPIAPALKGSILKSVPPFKAVAILMIVYLIAVVVLPYALVRPFRRLELAWVGVVAVALAGSGVVYGVGTRYLRAQSIACRVSLVEGGGVAGPHMRHNFWCLFSAGGGAVSLSFEDPPVVPFPFGRHLTLRGAGSPSEPLHASYDPDIQVRAFPTYAQDSVLLETTDSVVLPGSVRFEIESAGPDMLRGKIAADESLRLHDCWIIHGARIIRVAPGAFTIQAIEPNSPPPSGSLLEAKAFEGVTRALERVVPGDREPVLLYRYDGNPSLRNSDIKEESIHYGIVEPAQWKENVKSTLEWFTFLRYPAEDDFKERDVFEFTLRARDVPTGYRIASVRLRDSWSLYGDVELYNRETGLWVRLPYSYVSDPRPYINVNPFGVATLHGRILTTTLNQTYRLRNARGTPNVSVDLRADSTLRKAAGP